MPSSRNLRSNLLERVRGNLDGDAFHADDVHHHHDNYALNDYQSDEELEGAEATSGTQFNIKMYAQQGIDLIEPAADMGFGGMAKRPTSPWQWLLC